MLEGSERFDPADFEARYIEFARLLGFVSRKVGSMTTSQGVEIDSRSWQVLMDGEWYSDYGSEFRAAMEYIRYMGFTDQMREALDAIGAGEVQVPPYRNP